MSEQNRPVALVTGATSGIGAAIARRLCNDGFAVVLHSRSSADAGHSLAAELGNATYLQADLADEAARKTLVEQAADHWGRLDVLVNNAGISRVIPHADLDAATPAIWRELHEVNVVAPWQLITEAVPIMRRSGGSPSIVNIASHRTPASPEGGFHTLRCEQSGTHSYDEAAGGQPGAGDSCERRRARPGRHADDRGLGGCAKTLARTRANAARGSAGRYRCQIAYIAAMLVASKYLTGEIILADGGLNLT